MDKIELTKVLDEHRKWLTNSGGQRADLRRADLRGADLRGADLQGADLQDTIYNNVNWLLLIGIVPSVNNKCRAYKVTGKEGVGVYRGGINYLEADKFNVPKVDKDLSLACSYGINLANLAWCLTEYQKGRRLFLMEFNFKDAACPIGSDGKFRVKKCVKIGECDWKGNLLKAYCAGKGVRVNEKPNG